MVRLGDVLTHRKEFITIDDLAFYKRPRVQLHAQGLVLRDEVPGALIKTKKQQVCRAGEFLVAEIDAKAGGFGIVPAHLDGAIVSSHYFLFVADDTRLDREYLRYYSQTRAFGDQIEAQGSTNYAAVRPGDVLQYEIPLPPIEEQHRLVTRIDAVATKVDEAIALRGEITALQKASLAALFRQLTKSSEWKSLGDVAPLRRRPVSLDRTLTYGQVAVRSFGRGTFHHPPLRGSEVTWQKLFRVEAGDVLISNIKAWEGAIAVAQPMDHGFVASHRYLTCVPLEDIATAEFLAFYLLTPEGLHAVGEASPGSADRNRTLSIARLLEIRVPAPPLRDQAAFTALAGRVRRLASLSSEAETETLALVPTVVHRSFSAERVPVG